MKQKDEDNTVVSEITIKEMLEGIRLFKERYDKQIQLLENIIPDEPCVCDGFFGPFTMTKNQVINSAMSFTWPEEGYENFIIITENKQIDYEINNLRNVLFKHIEDKDGKRWEITQPIGKWYGSMEIDGKWYIHGQVNMEQLYKYLKIN